jgi:hypothetical protein
MSRADVATLAADLGLKTGAELQPPRRRGALPWQAGAPPAPPPAPLVPVEPLDDIVEFEPTTADYRRAARRASWVAVYVLGPTHAVPTIISGMELWPLCVGITANPRNLKAVAQQWNHLAITMHAVLWCEDKPTAERLREMLINALDYRSLQLSGRWYNVPPKDCLTLASEVAKRAHIPVFDEAERQRRLVAMVGQNLRALRGG